MTSPPLQNGKAPAWRPGHESHSHSSSTISAIPVDRQVCEHLERHVEILPRGSLHHAKEFCRRCGRFLRFLPKPSTVERQRLNSFRVTRLAMSDSLTDWERQFLKSIAPLKKLSPR